MNKLIKREFLPVGEESQSYTTAAGDTFTGFFIGSIAKGLSPKEAMQIAAKASAIAVSRQGAAPSIPELNEVYDFGR